MKEAAYVSHNPAAGKRDSNPLLWNLSLFSGRVSFSMITIVQSILGQEKRPMKKLLLLSALAASSFSNPGKAPVADGPVQWTYSSKKIADKTFEVHFAATIGKDKDGLPYHLYSSTTGFGLPIEFIFDENPLLEVQAKPAEVGKLECVYDKDIGDTLRYYEGNMEFIDTVKFKTNSKSDFTGSIKAMACTKEQCVTLDPVKFKVALEQ
jgi:thiol:disulfide interchange protein DsbD